MSATVALTPPTSSTASSAPLEGEAAELVGRLHRIVGESLTAAHSAHEDEGQGRLSVPDERALARKLLADELRRLATDAYSTGRQPLDEATEDAVMTAVLDRLHGLARLQPLLDDPSIRDIHISGANRVWLTMRDGTKVRGPSVAASDDELVELIATAARRLGRSERRWDHAQPELNLQLPNGDRLHALMAVSGRPTVTIRRHDFDIHRVDQLVARGVCNDLLARFLSAAVRARANVIVAGGTGTGKTTMLRCLINEIEPDERLITVEDSLEIGLERFENLHPDHETLEAREPNTEGVGAITLADLVRSALRMDPHRVIVGEVRGAEALRRRCCRPCDSTGTRRRSAPTGGRPTRDAGRTRVLLTRARRSCVRSPEGAAVAAPLVVGHDVARVPDHDLNLVVAGAGEVDVEVVRREAVLGPAEGGPLGPVHEAGVLADP